MSLSGVRVGTGFICYKHGLDAGKTVGQGINGVSFVQDRYNYGLCMQTMSLLDKLLELLCARHKAPDIIPLDNHFCKSRRPISIPTKLKLYNTCILPIFLYGFECWAVTKQD